MTVREDITTGMVAEAIENYIFSARDRAILKRRLIDGVYFEPLAEEFGLSVSRTKEIVYKGSSKIFRHL